jgi:hypothetical protein
MRGAEESLDPPEHAQSSAAMSVVIANITVPRLPVRDTHPPKEEI